MEIKKIINYLLCRVSLWLRLNRCFGYPYRIFVEPTNRCSLKCPICPTGSGELMKAKRNLSLDEFKEIIDKFGNRLIIINLYGLGEPFLNSEIYEMIKYVKARYRVWVSTHTNAQNMKDGNIDKLLFCGLDSLTVSLDGMDEESYQFYRIGGSYKKVEHFIKRFLEKRNVLKKRTPKIVLQCLVTKKNEKSLEIYKQKSLELGVDRIVFKTMGVWNGDFIQAEKFMPEIDKYRRYKKNTASVRKYNKICGDLYSRIFINSHGDIFPCCRDRFQEYKIGNIFSSDLKNIWNGKNMVELRKQQRRGTIQNTICNKCYRGRYSTIFEFRNKSAKYL